MSQLESDISQLSEAILGETLREITDWEQTLDKLKDGKGPFSLTLLMDDTGERHSLVLQEWEDGNILVFDPSHTLKPESQEADTGMVTVSESTVKGWFENREAIALIPSTAF